MTCFSWLLGRRDGASVKCSMEINEIFSAQNIKTYSYNELRMATGGFSSANKIGEGGFGSVYKGKLRGAGVAAVKVLSAESRQGIKEFLTEIKVISDTKHDNLVKLHGCCIEGNHRILVYEYVENNSLAQKLLRRQGYNVNDGNIMSDDGFRSIQFSWKIRTGICIGVAVGLAYLHEEVIPHIIHRDIKASNILLDKDLKPKIADFGLAKLFPPDVTHVSTHVAGTIGYLAPEYAVRGRLTRKADIYSFGVLVLEIVSGRCNKDNHLPLEEQYLLEWTWELYELGQLERLVDPMLHENYDPEEARRFLCVGLLCTQDSPKLRPPMSSVVKMLTGESKVSDKHIARPGLISDLMDVRIRAPAKAYSTKAATSSSSTITKFSNSSS